MIPPAARPFRPALLACVALGALAVLTDVHADARRGPVRTPAAVAPAAAGARFTRTELFFGRSRPDGTTVGDVEWERFVDAEITPRLSSGFTLLFGTGQFRAADGTTRREGSVLLILLHPEGQPDASRRIDEIRLAYARTFQQESVPRADGPVRVWF